MLARLAAHGNVDIVRNGREVVLAYVNTASIGKFYDLIVLNQNLSVMDGFKAVEMIRMYEAEHRKTGKRTMVCIISSDDLYQQQQNNDSANDNRTHILGAPVGLDFLGTLAGSVAAELAMGKRKSFVPARTRQSVSVNA
jgi:CheY-like chemotaxis protein